TNASIMAVRRAQSYSLGEPYANGPRPRYSCRSADRVVQTLSLNLVRNGQTPYVVFGFSRTSTVRLKADTTDVLTWLVSLMSQRDLGIDHRGPPGGNIAGDRANRRHHGTRSKHRDRIGAPETEQLGLHEPRCRQG